jgi:hypothetical protein
MLGDFVNRANQAPDLSGSGLQGGRMGFEGRQSVEIVVLDDTLDITKAHAELATQEDLLQPVQRLLPVVAISVAPH